MCICFVKGLSKTEIETELPVAEIVMCVGFFAICFLEELIHKLVAPYMKERRAKLNKSLEDISQNANACSSDLEINTSLADLRKRGDKGTRVGVKLDSCWSRNVAATLIRFDTA